MYKYVTKSKPAFLNFGHYVPHNQIKISNASLKKSKADSRCRCDCEV